MEASATLAPARLTQGRDTAPDLELAKRVTRRISIAMLLAHTAGALDVFAFLFWVFPAPNGVDLSEHLAPNLIAMAVYLPLTIGLGMYFGNRLSPERYAWIREGRAPTPEERDRALRTPDRCLRMDGGMWLGAVVLFFALNATISVDVAWHVALTIFLGGITVCAVAYVLAERIMRPITELALAAGGGPSRPVWPGVEGRVLIAWGSATGVPLIGLFCVGLHALGDETVSRAEILTSVIVLVAAAFVIGLGVMLVVARTVSRPLTQVRRALARVEAGDLSAEVRVDDSSEIGLLQSGFNRMVGGLRERERMEELFSRHVGEEVAREALEGDPRLGGEVAEVAVLFVDLVGSTTLATQAPPEHVVARLNRFFAIVVEVVGEHGGWVNKFEGDAALCVFGAPVPHDDPAACALAAARALRARLRADMPSADAGIGVSAGPAVAGWIGAERRFEYTVIGDPVNEAARLCELAKLREGRLLASEAIVSRADGDERRRWQLGESETLRGRPAPTRLAVPA